MTREETRDPWRSLGDVQRVPASVQPLVGGGEAVEAPQVIGPAVAREILDVAARMLDVLEEPPRHRSRAKPRAARLRHDVVELIRALRIDEVLDRHHHRAVARVDGVRGYGL